MQHKAHLHQVSASMLQQLCNDSDNIVLIENNGVASKLVATPFLSDFIVSNDISITSVIAALTLMLGVNGTWRTVHTERQHQCSDDTSDTTLIESNGAAPKRVATPFYSDCIPLC